MTDPQTARTADEPGAPESVIDTSAPIATVAAIPVEAVDPGPRPVRARNAVRWGVALTLVALIAIVSVTAFAVLAAGRSASSLVAFVPKDALAYVEVRSDLPGDQARKVADLMAHFPGFADRAALESKIGEAIDQQFKSSGSPWSYTKDVKPWLSGEVALAFPAGSFTPSSNSTQLPLFLLATKDPAAGIAFLKQVTGDRPSETRTIGGVSFTVVGSGDDAVAYGASGTTILIGRIEAVTAGLAAKEQGGLETTEGYKSAAKSLPGDHLAFGYVNYRALMQAMQSSMPAATAIPAALIERIVPPWMGFAVRAESDALILEAAAPNTRPTAPKPSTNQLAARLPGTTFIEFEARDLGLEIAELLELYRAIPAYRTALDDADAQARAALGNDLKGLTAWIGDTAFAVTRDNLVFGGGIVIQIKDTSSAEALAKRLRGFESALGTAIRVREEPFGSGTIVIYEPAEAGSAVPFLPGGTVQVAWSIQDDLLVIGLGPDFVKSVLQPTAGSTLADQPIYREAMSKAGTPNTSEMFINIASLVQLADLAIPVAAPQVSKQYSGIKPFLTPLQAFAVSSTVSGDTVVSRMVVTVK